MPIKIGAVVVLADKFGTDRYSFCPSRLPIKAAGKSHKPVMNDA